MDDSNDQTYHFLVKISQRYFVDIAQRIFTLWFIRRHVVQLRFKRHLQNAVVFMGSHANGV